MTWEDVYNATAITYPAAYRSAMKGETIKAILEDVADNLFNPDPYYQQGGDMVRVGGMGYTIDVDAAMGAASPTCTCWAPARRSRPTRTTSWPAGARSTRTPRVRRSGSRGRPPEGPAGPFGARTQERQVPASGQLTLLACRGDRLSPYLDGTTLARAVCSHRSTSILAWRWRGLVSFLSPCVLPLVPPYLGYISGTTIEQMTDKGGVDGHVWRRVVLASLLFVLGFTTVFVGLGAGASVLGQWVQAHKGELSIVAGRHHHRLRAALPRAAARAAALSPGALSGAACEGASLAGAFVMGLAFAFGWTPCIGPVLATVLTLAANEGSLGAGVRLLFVYSLGLGVPFVLAAMAIGPFVAFLQRFRRHLRHVEMVMGVLLVLTGVLMLTGSLNWFGQWLIENVPVLARIEEAVHAQAAADRDPEGRCEMTGHRRRPLRSPLPAPTAPAGPASRPTSRPSPPSASTAPRCITALTAQNTRGVDGRRAGAAVVRGWRRWRRCCPTSRSAPSRRACWPTPPSSQAVARAPARRLRAGRWWSIR